MSDPDGLLDESIGAIRVRCAAAALRGLDGRGPFVLPGDLRIDVQAGRGHDVIFRVPFADRARLAALIAPPPASAP